MFNINILKHVNPEQSTYFEDVGPISTKRMPFLMSVPKSTHNRIALIYMWMCIIGCVWFRQHPPRQSQNTNRWPTHDVQHKPFITCKPRAIDIFWMCSPIAAEHMSRLMSVLGSTHNRIALDYRCPYIFVCVRLRQHPPWQSQNTNTWATHDV